MVGADSRILFANEAANILLKNGAGINVNRSKISADGTKARSLQSAISSVATKGESRALLIPSKSLHALQLLIAPFSDYGGGVGEAALILVRDLGSFSHKLPWALGELYGLSAGEAEVAVGLAEGHDLAKIAERKGVTKSTVQTLLKRLMAKCELHRQASVVRMVAQLPKSPKL